MAVASVVAVAVAEKSRTSEYCFVRFLGIFRGFSVIFWVNSRMKSRLYGL